MYKPPQTRELMILGKFLPELHVYFLLWSMKIELHYTLIFITRTEIIHSIVS